MNSLFKSGWQSKILPLQETYFKVGDKLLTESGDIAKILKDIKTKMHNLNIGIPYRDSRLFFYKFLNDVYPDKIPDEFAERFLTRKPTGSEVNSLFGTMIMNSTNPGKFAEEAGEKFKKYAYDKEEDATMDRVSQFLDFIARNREEPKYEAEKERGITKPSEIKDVMSGKVKAFEKGKSGIDTLNKNLTPDTVFKFQEESPLGFPIYTTELNNLKYRVTLDDADGRPITLSQITPERIKSVIVVRPKKFTTVAEPTITGIPPRMKKQEEPVAFYQNEPDLDLSGPDPEELAFGGQRAKEELYGGETDIEDEPAPKAKPTPSKEVEIDFGDEPVKPKEKPKAQTLSDDEFTIEDEEGPKDKDDYDVLDLLRLGKPSRDPESMKDEDEPSENDAKKSTYDPDEDSEHEDTGKKETKKSSKQKDTEVKEAYRQRLKRYFSYERRNTLGY